MATHLQAQQPDKLPQQRERHKWLSQRTIIILTVILIAVIIAIIWILSTLGTIPKTWATISSMIITVLGALFTFLQSSHLFIPPDKHHTTVLSLPVTAPIIIQVPSTHILSPLPLSHSSYRGIVGLPPPTDPRTIQQREDLVKDIYNRLTQPGITALALTGIGGAGKSTLAALVYHYAKEQRRTNNTPFQSDTVWLTVDPVVTFADMAGNLFEALGKTLPDLSNLAPQNQALALFNALNTTDKPRLIILDQFENLLDWETGHALPDRPGVGEWLDVINSQQCRCRILLTGRPRPIGTREFPPTYLQEYPVGGLEITEGIDLLRKQGVNGTQEELRTAVAQCNGHAFSLTLLASLIRNHNMSLTPLFKDPTLWIGDIASNL